MPESCRFRIAGRAAADKAIAQLKPMPGVDQVNSL